MTDFPNLDDPNEAIFCIPFAGREGDDESQEAPFPQPLSHERDLPEGEKLRIEAYTAAWTKCLDRIKSIVHSLHAPIVSEIEHAVHTSYDEMLSGLPYPEIPVISITDPTSSAAFLDQIVALTDAFDLDGDIEASSGTAFTSHLYPNDCGTLAGAMKALIAGFIDRPHVLERAKGRPAVSLVNYDIEMLVVWYTAIREAHDISKEYQPKLVVILHDFEQLDVLVVQEIFAISSLYISKLPLVFILALSSPASPSFLHSTYPRSTMALLRVHNYTVPYGPKVLEEILIRTFFDLQFEPDLILGPAVLSYLTDYYTRHDSSIDAVLNILHLAHLKHFSGEPLTLLVRSTPLIGTLAQKTSLAFVEAVVTRLQTVKDGLEAGWTGQLLSSIIKATDDARASLYARARRVRIAFRLIKLVQEFMTGKGYKGISLGDGSRGSFSVMELAIGVLGGGRVQFNRDVKYLGTMVKKLKATQLGGLFEAMHSFFNSMPAGLRAFEEEARTTLVLAINALPDQADEDVTGTTSQVAGNFGEWLIGYLNGLLESLEEAPLWDVWYTGGSSFPDNLLNPSVRATVVAGLLHPYDFAPDSNEKEDVDDEQAEAELWELPDASILFYRYLDSGKMLNLYDWFEAFQQELETQQEKLKEQERSKLTSPRKRDAKGKGKGKEKAKTDEEMERRGLEIQARFMRAVQDLDYVGFLKHTGRKADHVQRIVYDIHD